MKNIVLFTALLITFAACKKDINPGDRNLDPAGNENIIGKWKESEHMSDPGNGSNIWHPADSLDPHFIIFINPGIVSMTSSADTLLGSYQISSDSTIILNIGHFKVERSFKLSATSLTISGGCIEACGTKYSRKTDY